MIQKAIKRMLSRKIELVDFRSLRREFDCQIISEYENKYPPREVALILGISITTVINRIINIEAINGENRETHWIIRAALNDVLQCDPKSIFSARAIFYKCICENALEESETVLGACQLLNISLPTLKKYADISGYPKGGNIAKELRLKRRHKNWWEK